MKRKFRYYQRQGWDVVEVDRVENDYNGNIFTYTQYSDRTVKHYRDMVAWCNDHIDIKDYVSTLHAASGTSKPGIKRFAFKHKKHATMFRLKWL